MAEAPPSDNLFVGSLPDWVTKEQFEEIMTTYGTVTSCRVLPPKGPGGKGSGLVRFSSVEEATWVVDNLNGNIAEGLEDPIVVRFANAPGGEKGGGWQSPGKGAPKVIAAKGVAKGGKASWGAAAKGGGHDDPPPGDNVFIGDVPPNCTQEEFEEIMTQYGTVVSCRLMPAKTPGNKGSGLVRFASVEEATWVCENLNGNLADGWPEPIRVRFASQGGSGGKGGKAAGGKGASPYGGGAKGASPYGGGAKGGKGAGTFFSMYGAIRKAGLLGSGETVPDECQLFVKNLPPDTTDNDLYKLFSPFGAMAPTGVKAMMNPDGSCKGIGFVDFVDAATALEAANTLNGFALPDGSCLGVTQKRPGGKGPKGAGKGAGKSKGA